MKRKKILLVDNDSSIPNLALMKLSMYHKNRGNRVDIKCLHNTFYPYAKKKTLNVDGYDRVYVSTIFDTNKDLVTGKNIQQGGTGINLTEVLPDKIERLNPDYSIYPECDYSIGFITRGCVRKCYFCKVPEKEGLIHQVDTVDNIIKHKKVKFLDNNILAFNKHPEILSEIIKANVRSTFIQGLDIRLVNKTNSLLLSKLHYINEYTFALDNITEIDTFDKKLSLMQWRRPWQFKSYVYVHPSMKVSDTVNRIKYLRSMKIYPYIMRDVSVYDSEFNLFYTDIAGWCNRPFAFKFLSFMDFMQYMYITRVKVIRKKSIERIKHNLELYDSK